MQIIRHWQYFCALEDDLAAARRYVEICEKNLDTYSIEFTHLLLAACSEFDVVAKIACNKIGTQRRKNESVNINYYRRVLLGHWPDLPRAVVEITYCVDIQPFLEWGLTPKKNPVWWTQHQKVKHERHKCFEEATLLNAVRALAGLYGLLVPLLDFDPSAIPRTVLFQSDYFRARNV